MAGGGGNVRSRRQRMGQHFLTDRRVARAIADALPAAPPRVVEIGPGRGALTRPLLARFPRVRALELDEALARALPRALSSPEGLEVVTGDAVTADLDELGAGGPWSPAGTPGVAARALAAELERPAYNTIPA